MNPAPKIDTAPADAGSVAVETAGEFIGSMFAETETPDTPAGERGQEAPPADEPAEEEGDFEAPVPAAPQPKPGDVAPIRQDEAIPDHVARKGDKSIATWKQLRAELEAERQKVVDIERDRATKELELEELKKKLETAPPAEEVEKLKGQITEYEDRLGQIDVTQTPHFRETYDRPLNELFGKVVHRLKQAGREEKDAVALARKSFQAGSDPAALEQILPDESAVTIGALSTLLEDRDLLVQKRNQAVENWRQTRETAAAELSRKQSLEISQQLSTVAEQAFDAVVKDGSWLYEKGQDPKWNEGVEARRNAAIGYIRAGKPADLARLILEGVAAPAYRKGYEKLKVRYDALEAQMEAMTKGRPNLAPRTPGSPAAPAPVRGPKTMEGTVDELWEE